MEFPKIETVFERDPNTFLVDPTRLKRSVYRTIREYDWTEKIDGTNIRISYTPGCHCPLQFGGRTDRANIPTPLLKWLMNNIDPELFKATFDCPVVVYGEGFGEGIQKGGKYGKVQFAAFDVLVDGRHWLAHDNIVDVSKKLGIATVPYWGRASLDQAVVAVRAGIPTSVPGADSSLLAEGLVGRTLEPLFIMSQGQYARVILKIKTRDFTLHQSRMAVFPRPSEPFASRRPGEPQADVLPVQAEPLPELLEGEPQGTAPSAAA